MILIEKIVSDMKVAMKAHDTARLSCIRLLRASVKQREVDERIAPTDDVVTAVIGKLIKLRRDSVTLYYAAGRVDLAAKESAEIEVLSAYMPQMMTEDEVRAVVASVVSEMGVSGMRAMGKVMGAVKGKLAGKADMGVVSGVVKRDLDG